MTTKYLKTKTANNTVTISTFTIAEEIDNYQWLNTILFLENRKLKHLWPFEEKYHEYFEHWMKYRARYYDLNERQAMLVWCCIGSDDPMGNKLVRSLIYSFYRAKKRQSESLIRKYLKNSKKDFQALIDY